MHNNAHFIRLHGDDNVVVAAAKLAEGAAVEGHCLGIEVPRGHKVAVRAIARDEAIRKYNQVIGFASQDIAPGDHVHTHNCDFRSDFERDPAPVRTPSRRPSSPRSSARLSKVSCGPMVGWAHATTLPF